MEVNYGGYPVFKGLQMPLEFMGIRGRFIVIAAATFGVAFLGFILFYVLFGTVPALHQAEERTSLQETASGYLHLQPPLRAIAS